ncbi:hypothetical protein SRRS_52610 [Sporomusa rhizae]
MICGNKLNKSNRKESPAKFVLIWQEIGFVGCNFLIYPSVSMSSVQANKNCSHLYMDFRQINM